MYTADLTESDWFEKEWEQRNENLEGINGIISAFSLLKTTLNLTDEQMQFVPAEPGMGLSALSVTAWQELVDPGSGQTYYYNSQTNESTWERPKGPLAPKAPTRRVSDDEKPSQRMMRNQRQPGLKKKPTRVGAHAIATRVEAHAIGRQSEPTSQRNGVRLKQRSQHALFQPGASGR
jgi:hypothetical protein